jgi:hypothetical protein
MQCALFFNQVKEVNGHTGEQTSGVVNRDVELNDLVIRAEATLRKLDGAKALSLFEQAALIAHRADIEIGIVRAHMQSGHSQQALAFCAHAAGAHLNEPSATLLYAHLLGLIGQRMYSERLMSECRVRFGENIAQRTTVRLAPYFETEGLPTRAKVLGSGLVLNDGEHVVMPSALMLRKTSSKLWVRFATGELSRAKIEDQVGADFLVLHLADKPRAKNNRVVAIAPRPAFPGSLAYIVQLKSSLVLEWPTLWTTFVGGAVDDSGHGSFSESRRFVDMLEVSSPVEGTPVLDQKGAVIGLLSGTNGRWQIMPLQAVPQLKENPSSTKDLTLKLAEDQIYQLGFNSAVQIIGG